MIDTLVLILHQHMFQVIDPELFRPSARWALDKDYSRQNHLILSKQNPTKNELANGIYKPRLTLSYRPNAHKQQEIMLKIDVSLPKLLFGNNFDELKYKDFSFSS